MSEGLEESGSLSEHEAQFGPNAAKHAVETEASTEPVAAELPLEAEAEEEKSEPAEAKAERTRDESGKFTKHRAQSQKASPEDVPRIKELTRKLREAEERAADYERRFTERATPSRASELPKETGQSRTSAEFGEKEPTIEQFANEADPYAAWIRAVNRYDRKKEAFEAEQERVAADRKRIEAEGQEYLVRKSQEYKAKVDEFSAANPDFNELMGQFEDWDLPPLAGATILEHSNGPQLVYNLMKQPEELAGLILLTDGKPVNEKTVALATRWLEKRALDVKTGSSAPVVQRKPTPTPPNPVRTVPSGSADSDDDVESMSLSSFEKKFHKGRR